MGLFLCKFSSFLSSFLSNQNRAICCRSPSRNEAGGEGEEGGKGEWQGRVESVDKIIIMFLFIRNEFPVEKVFSSLGHASLPPFHPEIARLTERIFLAVVLWQTAQRRPGRHDARARTRANNVVCT